MHIKKIMKEYFHQRLFSGKEFLFFYKSLCRIGGANVPRPHEGKHGGCTIRNGEWSSRSIAWTNICFDILRDC
jgi:hypothetical protein